MSYKHLKLDVQGDVAMLRLDRPPNNALNIDMLEELNDAVFSLRQHPALEVLVIRGSATCFSEGLDLEEHRPERVQRLIQVFMRFFETMRMTDAVQVAAVEGKAWGAGFELALGCNLFLAAEDASFKLPETSYGVFPPIAAVILPRVVPRRKAMEWILTGKDISARRLEHDGVINQLLPAAKFDEGVRAFIAEITAKSKPVLELAKRAQFEAYYAAFPEAMSRVQSLYLRELMELEDAKQGARARREGKPHTWLNR